MRGGIQMKINITPPKHYSDYKIHNMTKRYMKGEYNKTKAWNVFEGEEKRYYLFIRKRNIQIELINNEIDTLHEIENYLDYLFFNQYIGVSFEEMDTIQFNMKNVKCFYL
jgi:hypothetical protein